MVPLPRCLRSALLALAFGSAILHASRADETIRNLEYKSNVSGYEKERDKLDLYLPAKRSGFPTLVWFYGGGLTGGNRAISVTVHIAETFAKAGIAVAVPDYRLSPHATYPAYIEDAAAAFTWVHRHIAEYGGDPNLIFIGGHSAGGYLTSMLGMDRRYLEKLGLNQDDIAGLVPVSGQMMTHFTVRKERGIDEKTIIADEAAPIYYTRADTPPMLILMGDHDWPARLEENQYFAALQKVNGNANVKLIVIKDRDHGSIVGRIPQPGDPAASAILQFVEQTSKNRTDR